MRHRIRKLVEKVWTAKPKLDATRAVLVTESYRETEGEPQIIRRAKAFKKVLEEMPIIIDDGELIVGSPTTEPLGTPLYPEYVAHWIEKVLDELPTRKYEPTEVDEMTKKVLREKVFPYWRGKTLHEIIFNRLSPAIREVFFMDPFEYPPKDTELANLGAFASSGPGHVIFNPKVLYKGLNGIKEEIEEKLAKAPHETAKQFYEAALICIDAVINWAKRYANLARELAEKETDPKRKEELLKISEICSWVPANPARNFHEALQSFWFVFVASYIEEGGIGYSTGRFDEYMYPFYKKDIEEGRLTKEDALELLECLFIKFGWLNYSLKSHTAAKYHTGYRSFHFELGGRSKDGKDIINELSYLCIDAMLEVKLQNPSLRVHLTEDTPRDFLYKVAELVRAGLGHPSIFNGDLEVRHHLNRGIPLEEARTASFCGCDTPDPIGDAAYNYYGFYNLAGMLELALNNGYWKYGKKQLGPKTGDPRKFKTFDELFEAFRKQCAYFFQAAQIAFILLEQVHAELAPTPFASILIDGCIEKGLDRTMGGAKYNFSAHPCIAGFPDVVNSLAAIKKFVFDEKIITMDELLDALDKNFEGKEELRQMLINRAPKWGNDDDYVDSIAKRVAEMLFEEYKKVAEVNYRGRGARDVTFLTLGSNVPFGKVVGALPSGRKAGEPLSDAISPTHGTDRNGPTAVLKSLSKIDWAKIGFPILNMMFTPGALDKIDAFVDFLRSFVKLGCAHIQFNVVSKEMLLDAQKHPDRYRWLLVRVSGYCAYFVELSKDLQDDIIGRTAHGEIY